MPAPERKSFKLKHRAQRGLKAIQRGGRARRPAQYGKFPVKRFTQTKVPGTRHQGIHRENGIAPVIEKPHLPENDRAFA